MNPRILITGFGPFPGQPQNPSLSLVRSLRQSFARTHPNLALRAVELKTEYAAGWQKLEKTLESFKPDIVICFGVAAGEKGFRLEQTARNHCNTGLPDASGHSPESPQIQASEPDTYASALPLADIKAVLNDDRIPARLSDDASGYLCNFVFFNLMAHAEKSGTPVQAGFIHIPVPDQPNTLSRKQLKAGARMAIDACLRNI